MAPDAFVRMAWAKVLLMLAALVLAGCTNTEPYRTQFTDRGCIIGTRNCDHESLLKSASPEYALAFVEVDEQGVLHDREQMRRALEYIRTQQDSYVIVYVHGWHHTAKHDDSNVLRFQERLAFTKQRYPSRNIVGIYVGWRGESVPITGLNILTFWDRKTVSEEVGRNSLTEFFLRLEEAVRQTPHGVLLTVGHSFGASVVFNSVHQLMLERLVRSAGREVRGYGDLVVLVNPAIEAMRFTQLRDAAQVFQHERGFVSTQGPVMIVAASDGDWAAGQAFPVGRMLSTSLETHRRFQPPHRRLPIGENGWLDEGLLDVRAIGHAEPYTTHRLEANTSAGTDYACPDNRGWLAKTVAREQQVAGGAAAGERWDTGYARSHTHPPLIHDPSSMQVRHLGRSGAFDPYWITSTHVNVLPNHNAITQKHFWCFVDMALQEGGVQLLPPPVVQVESGPE